MTKYTKKQLKLLQATIDTNVKTLRSQEDLIRQRELKLLELSDKYNGQIEQVDRARRAAEQLVEGFARVSEAQWNLANAAVRLRRPARNISYQEEGAISKTEVKKEQWKL